MHTAQWRWFSCILFCIALSPILSADNPPGAPPKYLLVVRQHVQPGKAAQRKKLATQIAHAFDRANVPVSWVELESLTGVPEAVFLDAFDSFGELAGDQAMLGNAYGRISSLAQLQQGIEETIADSTSAIFMRRGDLSYRPYSLDLSKSHFVRITILESQPGHEPEARETLKTLTAVYAQSSSADTWVTYEVDSGTAASTFIVLTPMHRLSDADNDLTLERALRIAQRQGSQIGQAFLSIESNFYAVHPEMSHVGKGFAAGDPGFWKP